MKSQAGVLLRILILLVLLKVSSTMASTLTLDVHTDKLFYYSGEDISVYGSVLLNGAPVESAIVAIEIRDPAASPVVVQSVQTNSSGIYKTAFKLGAEASAGEYSASASCAHDGETAYNSASFQLRQVSALAVAVTTAKPDYTAGEDVTIMGNVTLSNIGLPQALVAIEVQNPNATPIIVRVLETDNQGSFSLVFPLVAGSTVGTYRVFASASREGVTTTAETSFVLKAEASRADVNGDGRVNILDLAMVAKAWGSSPGHPRWDARCDIDMNNIINIIDLTLVAKEYKT